MGYGQRYGLKESSTIVQAPQRFIIFGGQVQSLVQHESQNYIVIIIVQQRSKTRGHGAYTVENSNTKLMVAISKN